MRGVDCVCATEPPWSSANSVSPALLSTINSFIQRNRQVFHLSSPAPSFAPPSFGLAFDVSQLQSLSPEAKAAAAKAAAEVKAAAEAKAAADDLAAAPAIAHALQRMQLQVPSPFPQPDALCVACDVECILLTASAAHHACLSERGLD